MAEPYIGEIRMGGWNFEPQGWAFCNGQLLNISDNDVLFALLGTTYGGDGQNTFGLPDLRGRIPIHQGNSGQGALALGQSGGAETVTLNTNQIPSHAHTLAGTTANSNSASPVGNVLGQSAGASIYSGPGNPRAMGAAIQPTGGNQPHDNMPPYQCVTFIISLYGIFPSQN